MKILLFTLLLTIISTAHGNTEVTSVNDVDQTLATGVSREQRWKKRHQAMLKNYLKMPKVDLMFFGDSITAGWRRQVHVLKKHYGQYSIANMGSGGDRVEHMIWRLENGMEKGAQPKVIVLLCGTNNSNSNTPKQIAGGIFSLTDKLHKVYPKSQIVLIGTLPRLPHPKDRIGALAAPLTTKGTCGILASYHYPSYIHFLDLSKHYLNSDGSVNPQLFQDHVHLKTNGYDVWATQMKEKLLSLLNASASGDN